MDIVSSRFHQPGLAARLFLLLAFCFMGITQANAAVSAGEWQGANDLSVAQGDRFYDRSLGAYYTYNTVTANSGESLSGDLRLVVPSSSHSVLNADGTNADGKPFFMVPAGSAEHVVRINFQRKRGAFSYTTQMQRFVETTDPDSDSDGVPDSADICANTPEGEGVDVDGCAQSQLDDDNDRVNNVIDQCPNTPEGEEVDEVGCAQSQLDDDDDGIANSDDFCPGDSLNQCFTLNITVRGGSTPLPDVAVVVGIDAPGGATTSSSTDQDGELSVGVGHPGSIGDDGLDDFFPVSAIIDGFATGFAKVVLAPGVFEYDLLIDLAPVSDIIGDDENVAAGVSIEKEDETVGELTIPESSFPPEVTAITGQITYLDPEGDIGLTPGGDLLALPEGANPNEPVPLETFGMMEFDLVDQNGDPITDLAAPAEVCMKAGAGLAAGDTIPLWYYDDEAGLWIEEGQGTVEDRDGILMICGEVTHFSWWNYDQPIDTHSCFKYHFIDGDTGDSLREVFDWFAEGETYNGSSPERLCDRDGNDPVTPAPGDGDIDSLTVKRTTNELAPEQIRVATTISGNKYYLVDDDDGTYSLSTDVVDGTVFDNPVHNASCLNNTNVSDCLFLDYKEGPAADGVLPLDIDINLPPAITGFSSDLGQWGDLTIGASTNISALVTDLEGSDVTISWVAQCSGTGTDNGVLAPAGDSGPSGSSFTGQFTAPPALSQFYAYCELIITASDIQGNSATASHWLRIIDPSLSFAIQGIVYDTDGLPLPFQTLELTDWSCNDQATTLTVQTDVNGAYTLDANGATCGGEYYYWQLSTEFEHESRNWQYYSDLSACLDGAIEGDLSQTLVCERDIHLPTIWAPISGTVHGSTDNIYLDFQVSDYPWSYVATTLEYDGNASYGPIMVPVSSYGWGYTWNSVSGTSSNRSLQVLSTEGAIVDFGLANGDLTFTAYDNDGAPLANATVTGWADDGSFSIDTSLDEFGQLELTDVPLGRLWLTVTAADGSVYYGYGMLDVAGEHINVDVNSPDSCVISGVAYDLFGQPAPGVVVTAQTYSGNGWTSSTTVSDGVGAFSLTGRFAGGYNYLYQASEDYWSGYNTINNCRPDGAGNLPVIRMDVPERNNADYLLD